MVVVSGAVWVLMRLVVVVGDVVVADVCCCCSCGDDLMFGGRPAMETKNATLRKRARDPPAAIQPHQPPRIKHAIQQKHFNEQVSKVPSAIKRLHESRFHFPSFRHAQGRAVLL